MIPQEQTREYICAGSASAPAADKEAYARSEDMNDAGGSALHMMRGTDEVAGGPAPDDEMMADTLPGSAVVADGAVAQGAPGGSEPGPQEDAEFGEESPVRVRRSPYTPTRAEREKHAVDHYPYRSWCRSCVAAHGRRDPHISKHDETGDGSVSVFAMDYGFFCDETVGTATSVAIPEEDEGKYAPILVCVDKVSRNVFSDLVHRKGGDEYAVSKVVEHVLYLGHDAVKFRTDGEPAVKLLAEKAAVELKKRGVRVVPDLTPKGDSQAGGMQESAVGRVKAKTRCLWHQACEQHDITPDAKHHLLSWCVQYAGQLICRTVVGEDGKTGWRRTSGRVEFPRPLMPWGEKVHYIAGGGKMKPAGQGPSGRRGSSWDWWTSPMSTSLARRRVVCGATTRSGRTRGTRATRSCSRLSQGLPGG